MPSFNGFLCGLTLDGSTDSEVFGATGSQNVNVNDQVPMKYFKSGCFALKTTEGVSGAFGVQVVGGIGGATFVVAGITAVNAAGNNIIQHSLPAGATNTSFFGVPRPMYARFESAGDITGFTAEISFCGDY